jgi:hypothetical protein
MERKIELSKIKLIFNFIGSSLFVLMGFWFILKPSTFSKNLFGLEILVYIEGFASILFFGLVAILVFKKLLNKEPGFVINSKGITDNSSGTSAGFIPWSEIDSFQITKVFTQKFIAIILKDPEHYLSKVEGKFKKRSMTLNYKSSKSPVNISTNSLKISFGELLQLLNEGLKKSRISTI